MKEPHIEGVATHDGPESCVDARKGVGEALTGVRVGEVLSREIIPSGCRRGSGPEGNTPGALSRASGRSRAVQVPVHARYSPCARTGRSLIPIRNL